MNAVLLFASLFFYAWGGAGVFFCSADRNSNELLFDIGNGQVRDLQEMDLYSHTAYRYREFAVFQIF